MPSPVIDAVAVSTTDRDRTLAFYRCLGFEFPAEGDSPDHIEAIAAPGAVRLMIDSAELMERLSGHRPKPGTHSAFGLRFDTPAEVDEAAAKVAGAGFSVTVEPWDAFWGQRYATVSDPDCYLIDLFAPL